MLTNIVRKKLQLYKMCSSTTSSRKITLEVAIIQMQYIIIYLNLVALTPGAAGSRGEGGLRWRLLCESGIKLTPGFFQSVENRLWFETPETGLPPWSTTALPPDDVLTGVVVLVEGALVVSPIVVDILLVDKAADSVFLGAGTVVVLGANVEVKVYDAGAALVLMAEVG